MEIFAPARSSFPTLHFMVDFLIHAQHAASFQAALTNVTLLLVVEKELPVTPRHSEPDPS
jgi:hypothetical protein